MEKRNSNKKTVNKNKIFGKKALCWLTLCDILNIAPCVWGYLDCILLGGGTDAGSNNLGM